MPLLLSYPDPYSVNTLATAWAYCSEFYTNFENKSAKLVFAIHADKTSAYSGKPPIRRITINIYSTAQHGLPSFDDLVVANSTAYGLLLTAVDALALTQPEFQGGTVDA